MCRFSGAEEATATAAASRLQKQSLEGLSFLFLFRNQNITPRLLIAKSISFEKFNSSVKMPRGRE
jgi:hypothetical protein